MKYIGWALIIAGAAGAYYRYTVYQAASQGNPGLVNNSLKTFDPATWVGLDPGKGLLDTPMLVDAGVLVVGLVIVGKKVL